MCLEQSREQKAVGNLQKNKMPGRQGITEYFSLAKRYICLLFVLVRVIRGQIRVNTHLAADMPTRTTPLVNKSS